MLIRAMWLLSKLFKEKDWVQYNLTLVMTAANETSFQRRLERKVKVMESNELLILTQEFKVPTNLKLEAWITERKTKKESIHSNSQIKNECLI